jgi:hypothetical protein
MECLADAAKRLESWEIKLLVTQTVLLTFLALGYFASDASLSLMGISLKSAVGLKEILFGISTFMSLLIFALNGSKEIRYTIAATLIELKTPEQFREFAKINSPVAFHLLAYIPKQHSRWIFPRLITKISGAAVLILFAALLACVFIASIVFVIYVMIDIYRAPTLGAWSYAILGFVVTVYVLGLLWIVRMHVPLPFRDSSALLELRELEKTDPVAYRKKLAELF